MKKIIQFLKCYFGNHEWVEDEPTPYDLEYSKTRKCIHCDIIQTYYKGDWYNIN